MRRHGRSRNTGLNQLRDVVIGRRAADLFEQLDARDTGSIAVVATTAVGVVELAPFGNLIGGVTVLLRDYRHNRTADHGGETSGRKPENTAKSHANNSMRRPQRASWMWCGCRI